MKFETKTKCSFCQYWTGRSCMVTPNSAYCRVAQDEFYAYLKNNKNQPRTKSLRPWEKRK